LVHRLLRPARLALLAALAIAALPVASAGAANRRVAISDYRWSDPDIHIDLGEHVTWYWTGPDTIHSVTGSSANDQGIDSDPNSGVPHHAVGSWFKLTFPQPGTYSFQCKLHPFVRGTVTVSSTPGDPKSEPDAIPPNNVDLTPPTMSEVRLQRTRFRRRRGTVLRVTLDQRAVVDAEIYRLRRGHPRRYAGWRQWKGHVGYNYFGFGRASKHFKARPGRYVALIKATDDTYNVSRPTRVRFTIVGARRHHRHR
jgi:plastocyanin